MSLLKKIVNPDKAATTIVIYCCIPLFTIAVYIDLGRGPSDTASIAFGFGGNAAAMANANRRWEIKVSQVPCARFA